MCFPVPILANLDPHPSMMDSINFILEGFVFVMVVLAILGVMTTLIGMVFKRLDSAPASQELKKPAMESVTPHVVESEDPNMPVVIAAAVYTLMGEKPHRIVQIRPTNEGWAQEGRRSILGSHKVR